MQTLLSYNTSPGQQDTLHDRIFVQVMILGCLDATPDKSRYGDIVKAAERLLFVRVNGDSERMKCFNRYLESLRQLLVARTNK